MILQMNPEYEQDDTRSYLNLADSPLASSPAGNYWGNSPIDHSPLQSLSRSPLSPTLSSFLHSQRANQSKDSWVSNEQGRRVSHLDHLFPTSHKASAFQQTQSYGTASSYGSLNSNPGYVDSLSGWGSPSSSVWPMNPFSSNGKAHMFPYSAQNGSTHAHHHVGSAPSGFLPRSSEVSSIGSAASRGAIGNVVPRNMHEVGSPSFKMMSAPRHSQLFMGNGSSYPLSVATTASSDGPLEDGRSQQFGSSNINQVDIKKQFHLDLSKIMSGEDLRTTLMIKNIPNK